MWTLLDSQNAIDDLLGRFGSFHDGCLREVSIATDTYVDEQGAMAVPGNLDTSALLRFQRQSADLTAIELQCTGVSYFRFQPTKENCDSIIQSGNLNLEGGACRLVLHFLGLPLTGPPGGKLESSEPTDGADLEVKAQTMSWRPLESALGDQLHYRPRVG